MEFVQPEEASQGRNNFHVQLPNVWLWRKQIQAFLKDEQHEEERQWREVLVREIVIRF